MCCISNLLLQVCFRHMFLIVCVCMCLYARMCTLELYSLLLNACVCGSGCVSACGMCAYMHAIVPVCVCVCDVVR